MIYVFNCHVNIFPNSPCSHVFLHVPLFCSILLYTKVGEQAMMQEAGNVWLCCPSNGRLAGFGTVTELYLLHILVPLGHMTEARELVFGEVGGIAFTEDQK